MPTPVTVFHVTLILGDAADDEALGNSCADMQTWGEATGGRMESALATLAGVAQIDEHDPNAVAQLRQLSTRFTDLDRAIDGGDCARPARRTRNSSPPSTGLPGRSGRRQRGWRRATRTPSPRPWPTDVANALALSVLQRCGLTG